jgi:hypothetical protein
MTVEDFWLPPKISLGKFRPTVNEVEVQDLMPCKLFVFVRTAVLIAVAVCIANGDTITANLFAPDVGAAPVVIDLTGITTPSQSPLTGTGYSIAFSPGFSPDEGVVQGALSGSHAVPVAGVSGGQPEYLTGGFGSALTTNISASGNYLSTGLGTITITFTNPQDSLALLWGSIDTGNSLTLNDTDNLTVTGAEVQTAARGFVSNGYQGPGGSAYVIIDTDTPFTTASFTSNVVSFEFANIAASTEPFTPVPEPSSVALIVIGTGIGLVGVRRRQATRSRDQALALGFGAHPFIR